MRNPFLVKFQFPTDECGENDPRKKRVDGPFCAIYSRGYYDLSLPQVQLFCKSQVTAVIFAAKVSQQSASLADQL